MVDVETHTERPGGSPMPRMYSPAYQPLMQSLLATLANIDFEHDHHIARVKKSATETGVKAYLMARLQERHRERRRPYVQQLAVLERRIQGEWV